jgi:Flp pilus assembly protein TadG
MLIPRSPLRRRSQSGQAAVETALMVVPLFMLLLAIMDFSLAIFIMDTLGYAARQGARYAVTGQVTTIPGTPPTTLGQDASVRGVVRANALGLLNSVPDANITVNYYAFDEASNTWQSVTGTNSNGGGNMVKVSVTGYSWLWMLPGTNSFGNSRGGTNALAINVASADIMEGCPLGVCPTR